MNAVISSVAYVRRGIQVRSVPHMATLLHDREGEDTGREPRRVVSTRRASLQERPDD